MAVIQTSAWTACSVAFVLGATGGVRDWDSLVLVALLQALLRGGCCRRPVRHAGTDAVQGKERLNDHSERVLLNGLILVDTVLWQYDCAKQQATGLGLIQTLASSWPVPFGGARSTQIAVCCGASGSTRAPVAHA